MRGRGAGPARRTSWLAPPLLALALAGCAHPVAVAGQVMERDQVAGLLAQAEAAYARRPDRAQVLRAVYLYRSAAASDPNRLEGTVGVIRSVAWLLEHGSRDDLEELVATALSAGVQCLQRAPGMALCEYWQAVARGLSARENPATGLGEVRPIVDLLTHAASVAPDLEEGGPSRTLALLLLRAPGWPVGPGDPDLALAEARKAVAHGPGHPMNHLVLAEALAATGEVDAARAELREAKALGEALAAVGDPDGEGYAAQAVEVERKL